MDLKKFIRDVEDFPKKWVLFKDISPLLASPEAFSYCIDCMLEKCKGVDIIVWLDARWFLFAWAIAYKLWKPLVLVRKEWKLPYKTIQKSYSLEYGKNTFQIHKDSIHLDQKVAIIDDLLATGWTAKAAAELVEELWGIVDSFWFIVDLSFLWWSKVLQKYRQDSLITY